MTSVQATVRSWDPQVGGTALLADGRQVRLPVEVVAASAFRFLRPGQRVQVHLDGDRATQLGLPGTLPPG